MFDPGDMLGRIYLAGIEPNVKQGDRLRAFGRISHLRLSTIGRNPNTGQRVDVPTSIFLIGTVVSNEAQEQVSELREPPSIQELDDHVLILVSLYFGKPLRDIVGDEIFENNFEEDQNPIPGVGDIRLIELIIALEADMPCKIPDSAFDEIGTVNALRLAATKYCDTR